MNRHPQKCGVAAALLALSGAAPISAQEEEAAVRATPVAAPVPEATAPAQAEPAPAMPAPAFAPGPPQEGAPASPLPASPPAPAAAPPPAGPRLSEMQSRASIVGQAEQFERVPVFPDDPESAWWEVNPHYAFSRARREQRPLLLLFTGTWNPQAMALSEEVFSTRSFNDYAKENLVICYLNYPSNFNDAPEALRRIKEQFKVRGYPNVLVFNPDGEVERSITGYREGRPVDYFNRLQEICRPILESLESRKQAMRRAGYRDWENYLGREFFALFVRHDNERAVLRDATGQDWTVRINDLAPDDQRLVESFPPSEPIPSPGDEEEGP